MNSRHIAAVLAAACALDAAAQQIQSAEFRKIIRYEQIAPTTLQLRTDLPSYGFRANVFGNNISGITPPLAEGPFNVAALGAQHNGGRLVFDTANNVWRWGTAGLDFYTNSRSELNSLFPSGTYKFTIAGAGTFSVQLAGDAYPDPPRFTLSGGEWIGGAYHVNPAQAIGVATSAHSNWGIHPNANICIFLRGTGYNPPGESIIRSSNCISEQAFTQGGQSAPSLTLPAGSFIAGEEYTLHVAYQNHVSVSVPASARYVASTVVRIKTTTPVFQMTVASNITPQTATASAQIQFRPQDVGTTGSTFVFALAPQTLVNASPDGAEPLKVGLAKGLQKADTPIACVLAQLNAAGQMVAVTSANLAAFLTGVLGAQGASVSILNGVPTGNVSGATFFVGYGTSGTSMINTGINRAAVTVPGSLTCSPSAPQTGWWWNPLEDGRGFSLEKRGNNLFFAAFLYDISGRSTWYVSSGPVSLEGSLYNGDLLSASGGQTLGGPYVRFPTLATAGSMTLTFNNDSTGTMVWAGGTVPIQRFNIIQNGLTAQPVAGVPQSGWWWNENESGRGFFMEWQGNTLDIAGYMYDDNGNSVWYLTVGEIGGTASARSFNGTWWSYTGGQTLTGAWRQNTRSNSNVAPMTITFSGTETALMTLPNGRTTNLRRHRF